MTEDTETSDTDGLHLDDELIACAAEGRLSAIENAPVFAHLDSCDRCMELYESMLSDDFQVVDQVAHQVTNQEIPTGHRDSDTTEGVTSFPLRQVAAAVACVLTLGAVFYLVDRNRNEEREAILDRLESEELADSEAILRELGATYGEESVPRFLRAVQHSTAFGSREDQKFYLVSPRGGIQHTKPLRVLWVEVGAANSPKLRIEDEEQPSNVEPHEFTLEGEPLLNLVHGDREIRVMVSLIRELPTRFRSLEVLRASLLDMGGSRRDSRTFTFLDEDFAEQIANERAKIAKLAGSRDRARAIMSAEWSFRIAVEDLALFGEALEEWLAFYRTKPGDSFVLTRLSELFATLKIEPLETAFRKD